MQKDGAGSEKKVGGVENVNQEEGKKQEGAGKTDRRGPPPASMEVWEEKVNKYK